MYFEQQKQLAGAIRAALQSLYGIEVGTVVLEQPPELKFGEYATPVAFELARKLRKPSPRSNYRRLSRWTHCCGASVGSIRS